MTSYTIVGVPCIGSLLAQMYCIANCIFEWFSLSRCGPSKILKWNECVLILYICFCTMMVREGVEGTHKQKKCCIQIFVTNMIHLCPKDFLLCGKNGFNPPPLPAPTPLHVGKAYTGCWVLISFIAAWIMLGPTTYRSRNIYCPFINKMKPHYMRPQ